MAAFAVWGFTIHRNHFFPYRLLRGAYDSLAPAALPHRFHPGRRGEADGSPEKTGVRTYDRALAQDGLNFWTSGHAPVAVLMDMEGTLRKTWTADARKIFPGLVLSGDEVERDQYIRCARLMEDGGIVGMFDEIGLFRLDEASRPVWAYRRRVHGDFFLAPSGGLWVLSHEKRAAPELSRNDQLWEDFVEELSAEGRPVRKLSLLEAFRRSPYAPLLFRMPAGADALRTNSLHVLDGSLAARSPLFRRGNILLSLGGLDVLAIFDPDAGKIVWALAGQWRAQHAARLLSSGRILLFDNLGTMREASRALEVDPFTQEIAWSFGGRPGEALLSEASGFAEHLSGGNTMVVESNFGRALEVTPDGRIAWEFVNPNRAGRQRGLVATLYRLERVPRNLPFLRRQAPF